MGFKYSNNRDEEIALAPELLKRATDHIEKLK
jgi:hypothetical protein